MRPTEPIVQEEEVTFSCGQVTLSSMPVAKLFQTSSSGMKHVVTVNAEIFACAHRNETLRRLMQDTVNTVDGRVLQMLCQRLYPEHRIRKLSGSNFIYELAEHCAKSGEKLFLLGANDKSNQEATRRLLEKFLGLAVEGYSPPLGEISDPEWNRDILSRVQRARPTHLVVCFGPPKQEFWIRQNQHFLFESGVRCSYGLGGTLDFVAGRKRRAPRIVESMGLEWMFRFLCEPNRRFSRTAMMFLMPYYAAKTVRKIEVNTPRFSTRVPDVAGAADKD